jgi:hypothetical protein
MDLKDISREEILKRLEDLSKDRLPYGDVIMKRDEANWVEPDGYVEVDGTGKSTGAGFLVKGNAVYMPCYGGKPMSVGFVKEGIAYMENYGGKPMVLGRVRYY